MKTVQNIVLFLSIIVCIGLIYISFFNVYQTDDYIWSYSTRKLGLVGSFKETYMNWGGRYFGYGVSMFNPVFFDHNGIFPKVYPVFLILSFIGVMALNGKEYFKYSWRESLQKAIMLFLFYTVLLISIPEHYYWITGATIYFLPAILSGLLLYFLKKNEETNAGKVWFYFSVLLIIVLMGSNEILALILEGLLLLLYFQKRSKEYLIFLGVGSIFFLLSFLAPGNFSRMGDTQEGIIKWVKRVGIFGANTMYIALKTIVVIPLFIKVFEKELTTIREKIPFRKAFLVWVVSLLPLLFTGFIVNTIGRQFENVTFYFCVTFSLVLIYKYEKIKQLWWLTFLIIFIPEHKIFPEKYSNFDVDFNMAHITQELVSTDLKGYEKEVNERIKIISHTPGDSVVVEKIKNVPRVLYFDEMASMKEDETYVNDQLQKYFNKKYIRTKE